MFYSLFFLILPSEFQSNNIRIPIKASPIFSHSWLDTLKTKDDTQAVYYKFDMKIILMPLWKEKKA